MKSVEKITSIQLENYGTIELDEETGKWYYMENKESAKGRQKYSIGVTSEGVKKVAILN